MTFAKVSKGNVKGVPGRVRLALGTLIGVLASAAAMYVHPAELQGQLAVPIFSEVLVTLGWFFIPVGAFVIVGAAQFREPDRRAGRAGDHAGDDCGRHAGG